MKIRSRISALLLTLAMFTVLFVPAAAAETAKGTVIRLTKTEGTVNISKSNGKTVSLSANMRLYNGYQDGSAAQATFSGSQGVAVGEDGTVYVADTDNSAIRQIKNGQVTTLVARDVTDLSSFFPITPSNLLVHGDTLYICDPFACKLLAYSLCEVTE